MKIISFTIFKGGTGKTTSSVNTAVALVRHGKRVLLVDLDQQASATRYLGLDPESSPSLYQVFLGARSGPAPSDAPRWGWTCSALTPTWRRSSRPWNPATS